MESSRAPTLVTLRLTLRAFQRDDLDALAAIYADPEVTRFLRSGVRTGEQTAAVLDEYIAEWRDVGYGVWAVEARDSHTLLGMCGFVGKAELGYVFGRVAWGRGIATEAARACLQYGFERLGWDVIGAGALRANSASLRVLEKLGMRPAPNDYFDANGGAWFVLRREDSLTI
ncbi:MAG TPA: GNAT family N-acetyltransferase [Ktedonobacterales bacterium]|nr:GNAT family N-acetyltransferase [Ktedonobacterales bacterium]